MSHMLADTEDELHAMAEKVGLRRAWFQSHSTPHSRTQDLLNPFAKLVRPAIRRVPDGFAVDTQRLEGAFALPPYCYHLSYGESFQECMQRIRPGFDLFFRRRAVGEHVTLMVRVTCEGIPQHEVVTIHQSKHAIPYDRGRWFQRSFRNAFAVREHRSAGAVLRL